MLWQRVRYMSNAHKQNQSSKQPNRPFVVREIMELPVVRNVLPVPESSKEYSFELTDGSGFDKTNYKVYILTSRTTGQPVISTVLTSGAELFGSKYISDICFRHGLSASINNNQVVLSMKLRSKGSNILTVMKFYDFLVSLKTLLEFREIINRNEPEEL